MFWVFLDQGKYINKESVKFKFKVYEGKKFKFLGLQNFGLYCTKHKKSQKIHILFDEGCM